MSDTRQLILDRVKAALAILPDKKPLKTTLDRDRSDDAIAALGDDPNVIFCTGPSKTADVEGILIEGVHGPGEQVALIY